MNKKVHKRALIPEMDIDTTIRITEAEKKAYNATLEEHDVTNAWGLRRAIQLFIDKYSG